MPTFSFVGDEPLSAACPVMFSNSKETKQTDIHADAGSLKDSSHTQVAKSYSSHANPPERSSSSTTTTQYKYSSTRISHSEPGPLGVVIRIGERSCSARAARNDKSMRTSILQRALKRWK